MPPKPDFGPKWMILHHKSDLRASESIDLPLGTTIPIMIRQRLIFQGRVQRVGFRARARMAAENHCVTGWVRNEPDGTVMLEVQGTPDAVDAYLADLRKRISGLVEREIHATIREEPNETGFAIIRHH